MVKTIEWTPEGVVMIDQRILPTEEAYITCKNYEEVADAIRTMVIRGAPAIGYREYLKAFALFRKLPDLEKRLQALERGLEE